MKADKIITLGAAGAVACVGACAVAALIPAALATGGLAFLSSSLLGWPVAIGLVFLVAAGVLYWRARARRSQQSACGCATRETAQ